MKNLFDMIPPYAVSTLGWTLLHALWQGTLLALLAAAGFYAFRRRPASWRYTLGVSLLAGQVLASLGTFAYYWVSRPASLPVGTSPTTGGTSAVALVQAWQQVNYPSLTSLERLQLWLSTHLPELVVCWLVGAGLLLLRFVGSWVYLEVLRSRARLVMDKDWRTRFGLLTAKLNITQSVELRQTARVLSPLVIGVLRPVVLVPVGLLTGFSVAEVEAILAHELAHIRRHDYLVNLLQSLVEIVFFFHPALWWLSERVRTEREHCCDDLAVAACGDRTSLAQALVRVAELQANPRLAMAFTSRKPLLLRRIRRVLGVAPAPRRLIGTVPALLILTGLLVGVSLYAVGQQEAQEKSRKKGRAAQVVSPVEARETLEIEAAVNLEELVEVPPLVEIPELEELAEWPGETTPQPRYQVMEGDIYRYQESANDTTQKRLETHQRTIQALQEQMEPLHRRMEELHLAMEKQQFDVERYHRAQEQIEWKKQQLMDGRQKLMEKRSALLYPQAAKGQAPAKLSESEVEKQLGELEQKVKEQELKITELNAQLAQNRKEAHQVEEPSRTIQKEMEAIGQKMEVIGSQINREAREMEKYLPPPPPPVHVYGTGKKTVPPAPADFPPPPPVEKPTKATSIQGKAKVAPAASPKAASPAKK